MENGLAYHFVIGNGQGSPDGHVEVGNRWTGQIQGGHVKSLALNEVSIGICLVGNFEKTVPTEKQLAATEDLVRYLSERAVPGELDLCLHRDLEATLCPGRLFPAARFRSIAKA
jgi:N-acetyl-anhydromuramyl-L-alanine amidase AmpD